MPLTFQYNAENGFNTFSTHLQVQRPFNTFSTHLQVQRLRRRDFRGCELLALLHELARCGSPGMQSCMQRLLWHCNQVLLKQLTSW